MLVLLGLCLATAVFAAASRPQNFLGDDSFFYQQIANNVASGHGSTFSQIVPTNGYHPLWLALSALVHLLAAADKSMALRLVIVVQAAMTAGILFLFWRLARRVGWGSAWVSLGLLAAFFSSGMYGSEAHVNGLFLVATVLTAVSVAHSPSIGRSLGCGVLGGFAILARLDNAVVLAPLLAVVLVLTLRGPTPRRWGCALALLAPPILLTGGYLAYNLLAFGHALPISGALKSTFPHAQWTWPGLPALGLISAAAALALAVCVPLTHRSRRDAAVLWSYAAGVLALMIYNYLFVAGGWGDWSWYYVSGVLALALVVASIETTLLTRGRFPRAVLVVAIALCIVLASMGSVRAWGRWFNGMDENAALRMDFTTRTRWYYDVAGWLDSNLPAGTAVYVWDAGGMFAYYTRLRVLPVDGLVNDYDYSRELLRYGVGEYLRMKGVGYYLGPMGDKADFYAPLTGQHVGSLDSGNRVLVARLRDVLPAASGIPDIGLWRLTTSEP